MGQHFLELRGKGCKFLSLIWSLHKFYVIISCSENFHSIWCCSCNFRKIQLKGSNFRKFQQRRSNLLLQSPLLSVTSFPKYQKCPSQITIFGTSCEQPWPILGLKVWNICLFITSSKQPFDGKELRLFFLKLIFTWIKQLPYSFQEEFWPVMVQVLISDHLPSGTT